MVQMKCCISGMMIKMNLMQFQIGGPSDLLDNYKAMHRYSTRTSEPARARQHQGPSKPVETAGSLAGSAGELLRPALAHTRSR